MNIQMKNMKTKNDISISLTGVVLLAAFIFTSVEAAPLTVPNTFTDGNVLTADELNTNFGEVKTAVDDNATASRFYGDGSAGALTISAAIDWVITPPTGNNLNFTNIVIDASNTLTVPAGTTIRCNGTFTNNGTITVADANNGGLYFIIALQGNPGKPGGRGDAQGAAGKPGVDTAGAASLIAGIGGVGIPQTVAASSFNYFKTGGGAGTGVPGLFGIGQGSDGGGLVKISCRGGIINNGTINALGGSAGGGGGGGIVILASSTSIDNDNGTINADGGNGSDNANSITFLGNSSKGASGGGGGGIIAMVAPSITNLGTASVKGGGAGTDGLTLTENTRSAGGGGGASGGDGGSGGSVSGSVAGAAVAGSDGYVLEITANPAFMM